MFRSAYRGRRVLVTGHTGFKGAWLSQWLLQLGAEVSGVALAPETTPNLFSLLGLESRMRHQIIDIRDAEALHRAVAQIQPELVLHLAAQPLVRLSYRTPVETWQTNVMGTINVMEAMRKVPALRGAVMITSDKCYENREWPWGYRETEAMGGYDPYSSSKGAAEVAIASWRRSFFSAPGTPRIASARAGNVIGGGDWAADRIVTDIIAAIGADKPVVLRNPQATRPWQHVLEPLSGYLELGSRLLGDKPEGIADGWNFGPVDASIMTVEALTTRMIAAWGQGSLEIHRNPNQPHEAGLLKLDCSKALHALGWHSVWNFPQTVDHTIAWYKAHSQSSDMQAFTTQQIAQYQADALAAQLPWTAA